MQNRREDVPTPRRTEEQLTQPARIARWIWSAVHRHRTDWHSRQAENRFDDAARLVAAFSLLHALEHAGLTPRDFDNADGKEALEAFVAANSFTAVLQIHDELFFAASLGAKSHWLYVQNELHKLLP